MSHPAGVPEGPEAEVLRRLTAEIESLLEQAAGFARGGDYLGAQARARFAEQRSRAGSAALAADDPFVTATRGSLNLRLEHYDALARQWQSEVEARHTAFVARERRIIGGAPSPPALLPPAAAPVRRPG